jgi:HlyD family secretion protein
MNLQKLKSWSKKKKVLVGVIIVTILVLIIVGVKIRNNNLKDQVENVNQTYEVSLMNLSQVYSTTGTIASKNEITLDSPFSSEEFILDVIVGNSVNEGDIIGHFDDRDIKIDLLNQERTVLSLEYQLKQLKGEGNKQFLSGLQNTSSSYDSAKQTYETNLELYGTGAISLSELNNSQDAMDNAYASYDVSRSQYYGFDMENEIAMLEKSLAVEQIKLEKLQQDFESVELKAPMTGVVSQVFVESSDSVVQGQQLITFVDLEHLEVVAQISQYEVGALEEGQQAFLTVLGNENIRGSGNISLVYPTGTSSGSEVSFTTLIDVIKASDALRPGFSVTIDITLASAEDALVVPYDALNKTPTGYSVTRLLGENEEDISVTTGVESDLMIQIFSEEIAAGDIVRVYSDIDYSIALEKEGMLLPGGATGPGSGQGIKK